MGWEARARLASAAVAVVAATGALVGGWAPWGAAPAPVAAAGDLPAGVVQVDLGGRGYLLAAAPGTRGLPLLVVLHGRTDSAARFLAASGALEWARTGRAVVAAPVTAPRLSPTSWNAGDCCDGAAAGGVDDVGTVARVIADAAARTGASSRRVSVLGFSNGAMLAYRAACERPGLLAGLVAVAGARLVPCEGPGELRLLQLHGALDAAVPLAGATAAGSRLGVALPSAAESGRPWRGDLVVLPGTGHRLTAEMGALAEDFLVRHGLLAGRRR